MRLREFGSQSHRLVRDGPSIGPPAVGFHTNLSPLPRFISNCEQINHGILQIQVIEERRAEMEMSWSPFQGFVCRKDQASQRTGASSSTRTGKTVRTPRVGSETKGFTSIDNTVVDRTSLVAQWIWILPASSGDRVPCQIQEDSTYRRATKPPPSRTYDHNYWSPYT